MTHGEEKARRDSRVAEMIAATGYERGDSRAPVFGERIMGIWAGESNPHRIGRYVETKRRTGRLNPGVWYRLTDGRGGFWEYEASQTLFVPDSPTEETNQDGGRSSEPSEQARFGTAARAPSSAQPTLETFSVDPAPDAAAPTVPSGQVGFVTVTR